MPVWSMREDPVRDILRETQVRSDLRSFLHDQPVGPLMLRLGIVAASIAILVAAVEIATAPLPAAVSVANDKAPEADPVLVAVTKPVLLVDGGSGPRRVVEGSLVPGLLSTSFDQTLPQKPDAVVVDNPTVAPSVEVQPVLAQTTLVKTQAVEAPAAVEPVVEIPKQAISQPAKDVAKIKPKAVVLAALEQPAPLVAAESAPAAGSRRFQPADLGGALDGATLRYGGQTLRLAGLIVPALGDSCRSPRGSGSWTCGTRARGALFRSVNGQPVDCTLGRRLQDGAISARCTVKGEDIGARQIAEGWARSAGKSDAAILALETAAQNARKGLWRSGWAILRGGKPVAEASAVP